MPHDSSPPPSAAEPPDWEALSRFLSGDASPDEAERIAAYMAAHPDDAHIVAAVQRASMSLGAELRKPVNTEAALASVLARRTDTPEDRSIRPISSAPSQVGSVRPISGAPSTGGSRVGAALSKRPQQLQSGFWRTPAFAWRASAAAALLLIATSLWVRRTSDVELTTPTRVAAAVGTPESVVLPDGTQVLLGPASTLAYDADYGVAAREVTLTGDGFFTVTRDDARPFTVRAGDATVVDLSTAFAVRTDGVRGVTVAVTDGRVRLSHANAPANAMELSAGESGLVPRSGQLAVRDSADVDDAVAWTRGQLVFRDAPLDDVATSLQRWFAVVAIADSALQTRRLTATFDGDARETVLNAIALSLGAELTMRGDTVLFRMRAVDAR